MPPRWQMQIAPAARSTVYVCRYVKDVFNDFIGLIEGPVSGETDDGTVHDRNNVHHSALLRCNAENTLPAGEPETEERSRQLRTSLEKVIIVRVMQDNLRVWASSTNSCPIHVARRTADRAFQFNNITVLHHLFKYRTGITKYMKWMVFERSEKLHSGSVIAPFPMKRISQVIPCCFRRNMIHAIGLQRLKEKKNPTETSFSLQMNSRGRIILHIFCAVNAIGMLLEDILDSASCKWYEGACSSASNAIHPKLGQPKHCVSTPSSCEISSMMMCGRFFKKQYSRCKCDSLQITYPSIAAGDVTTTSSLCLFLCSAIIQSEHNKFEILSFYVHFMFSSYKRLTS